MGGGGEDISHPNLMECSMQGRRALTIRIGFGAHSASAWVRGG